MAYPDVVAPYGLKPINLIGGQVFAGSTRNLPIQYGYNANLYYGDLVKLVRGFVVQSTITNNSGNSAFNSTPTDAVIGVFLGCSYTNPTTKQKQFAQYWPAGTTAGDAVAIIADDPDQVFKAAVQVAAGTLASGSNALVGQNIAINRSWAAGTGNINTGNSYIGVTAPTSLTSPGTILPIRVMGVVPETAYTTSATGTSSTTTITLTGSGLPTAIPVGTDVGYITANGQYYSSGSFVTTAVAAGGTSVTINAAMAVEGTGATFVFTVYPEVLVKLNMGVHSYYNPNAV
jgi:hypothetical protein